ncbi:MAG: hypothetical protein ACJ8C4_12880 [Gemmataceae bacterium]
MTAAIATSAMAPPPINKGVLDLAPDGGVAFRLGWSSPLRSDPFRPAATLAGAATNTSWQRLQRTLLPTRLSFIATLFSQAGQVTVTAISTVLSNKRPTFRRTDKFDFQLGIDDHRFTVLRSG